MFTRLALTGLLGLTVFSAAHAERAPLAATGRVEVAVTGLRSSKGQVYVALWRSDKKFPGTPPPGTASRTVKIVKNMARAEFLDQAAGEFAVTVFHDEDGDGELKTNFIGIPREGIGFSRDARARIGAPDYDDAKLMLLPGQTERLKITMWYL